MRRIFPLVILLFIFSILYLAFSLKAFATFSEVYLRLDRQTTSVATTGLICAKPATDDAENSVEITFPTGFTVSTSTGNWTTATTNLPSGATAWSGIGTAISISGQTVTFPSSNLSTGTLYCFRWTNNAALTTAGSAGESYNGSVATKNTGGSTIDTSNFALGLISADQLAVSATVAANPTDFQADLSSSTSGSPFAQNTTIDYQINYGSYLLYPSSIILEVEWTLGTIEGSSVPSVEIVDYVVGSASNGYGSTAPVIDLVNRKISWSISGFPANTVDQTVTFKLKTNSAYTGSKQVNFSAKARIIGPGMQSADSTITRGYKYSSPATPTSTPTPGLTATPTPTTTPVSALAISKVEIRNISVDKAVVFVRTSSATSLIIKYGTSPNSLNQTLRDSTLAIDHLLSFGSLGSKTKYYFRITVTNSAGSSTSSDVFTFETAASSQAAKIDINSIVIASSDVILFAPKPGAKAEIPIIVLPKNIPYSFHFFINDFALIERIKMVLRNKKVLGISTLDQGISASGIEVFEIGDGVYEGRLKAPLTTGVYELYAQIFDKNGNLAENLIANLQIVNRFTVLEKGTNNPVESARVFFYIYNSRSKLFNPIHLGILSIENPAYTNPQGELVSPLPLGKYKAEIMTVGYKPQEVIFSLDTSLSGGKYPTVYLEKTPFSLIAAGLYFTTVGTDVLNELQILIQNFSQSVRFFNFMAIMILTIFVYLTILAFSFRIKIPLHSFLHYIKHRREIKKNLDKTEEFSGLIYDQQTKQPIPNADLFLVEKGGTKTLAHTTSDSEGKFSFKKLPNVFYNLQVMKETYEPVLFTEPKILKKQEASLPLYIHKHSRHVSLVTEQIKVGTKNTLAILFETFLITSLLLELTIGYSLGWMRALPFITLSLLNLILWVDHLGYKTPLIEIE